MKSDKYIVNVAVTYKASGISALVAPSNDTHLT